VGVVLAAGAGTRLNHGPKPLKRIAGRTLLERAVLTLEAVGVAPIVVVTGHARDEIARYVAERGLAVELVENDDFHLGNGSSALVGGRAAFTIATPEPASARMRLDRSQLQRAVACELDVTGQLRCSRIYGR
jgi:CTP:molybdopterin cytidylyltransferase MocA